MGAIGAMAFNGRSRGPRAWSWFGRRKASLLLAPLMSGCAVDLGPIAVDAPTLPASYQAGAEPSHATRRDLRDWWQAFRDPTLTRLIVLANAQNLSIEQARLRLAAGRALGDAASTLFLPTASGGGQALGGTRRRDSDDWLRRPLRRGWRRVGISGCSACRRIPRVLPRLRPRFSPRIRRPSAWWSRRRSPARTSACVRRSSGTLHSLRCLCFASAPANWPIRGSKRVSHRRGSWTKLAV